MRKYSELSQDPDPESDERQQVKNLKLDQKVVKFSIVDRSGFLF